MRMSEKLDQLLPALAKARVNFGEIKKTKTNPHFNRKYAALDDILPAIDHALAAEGLLLIGDLDQGQEGMITVTTRLIHVSEQWIESTIDLTYPVGNLQKLGGDITYVRRYSINTMLQLAADEDLDDQTSAGEGNARTRDRQPRTTRTEEKEAPDHPTADQINALIELSKMAGVDLATFGQHMRRLMDLPAEAKITRKFLAETMTLSQLEAAAAEYNAQLKAPVEAEGIGEEDDVPDHDPSYVPVKPQDDADDATAVPGGETGEVSSPRERGPESTHVESTGVTYATDRQMEALNTLAAQIGPEAERDLAQFTEEHHGRLPMEAYLAREVALVQARARQEHRTAKARTS